MSLLSALLKSYDYALANNMVDKINEFGEVILPIYHNSMKSTGNNIVEVLLSKNGEVLGAEFLPEKDIIIFPVSEDSVARSSGIAPHPLVDNGDYLLVNGSPKNKVYLEQLTLWATYSNYDYLKILYQAITSLDFSNQIFEALFGTYEIQKNENKRVVIEKRSDGKNHNWDFSKIFVTFKVEDYQEKTDISITQNKELHQDYIQFVEHCNQMDEKRPRLVCNISGQPDYLSNKHRPLIATARLISQITANKENYFGRFDAADATIKIGMETSQKIHLMAKYLLEAKQSCRKLGESGSLVVWFSEDLQNNAHFDLLAEPIEESVLAHIAALELNGNQEKRKPLDQRTQKIANSFISGCAKLSDHSSCYIAIFDKVSNGRVAVKYFRELDVSSLKQNLQKWQDQYSWLKYFPPTQKEEVVTPGSFRILLSAYGVERNKKLALDNKKFTSGQMQNIISAIAEGRSLPQNFISALEKNVRNRQNYKYTWPIVKNTALAILYPTYLQQTALVEMKGANKKMLDRANTDRSYLYGRLLALYERLEASCFRKDNDRVTNAEKLWNAYVNKPALMNFRLRNALKPYEKKLKSSPESAGLYYKIRKDIAEVSNMLAENYDYQEEVANRPLGPGFIFGYEAQLQDIFTKKNSKEEEDAEQ